MLEPEDVINHLGKGIVHWKAGYSAQALATSWFSANGIPPAIRTTLETCADFSGADLVDAFFERTVDLGDGKEPTHTDLLAILRVHGELAVLAVEGKRDETFGELVGDWLAANPERRVRLDRFCAQLRIPHPKNNLRYQLFHRALSAVLEAQRYCARRAVLLVQSFSEKMSGFDDFVAFAGNAGIAGPILPGQICGPITCSTVLLHMAWVSDDPGTWADVDTFWKRLANYADKQRVQSDETLAWIEKRRTLE